MYTAKYLQIIPVKVKNSVKNTRNKRENSITTAKENRKIPENLEFLNKKLYK